jgi:hypothetical protein
VPHRQNGSHDAQRAMAVAAEGFSELAARWSAPDTTRDTADLGDLADTVRQVEALVADECAHAARLLHGLLERS